MSGTSLGRGSSAALLIRTHSCRRSRCENSHRFGFSTIRRRDSPSLARPPPPIGRPDPRCFLECRDRFHPQRFGDTVAETGTASAARGLPDLATAIAVDGGALIAPPRNPGTSCTSPRPCASPGSRTALGLPISRSARPRQDPFGAAEALRRAGPARRRGRAGAGRARSRSPGRTAAFLTPALFGHGFVRLQVVAGQGALAQALREELAQPVAIATDGLDSTRLIRRLTPEAALLLRGALIDGALTVRRGCGTVTARARRASARDRHLLPTRTLLDALLQRADSQQRIAVSAITDLWPAALAACRHGNRRRRAPASSRRR